MDEQAKQAITAISPSIERTERKEILVVEDNADVLHIFGELLTILGYTFRGVQSAEAAMELLSESDTFDILFTDITLPGMSGIDLAKKVAQTRPLIKIIFTSGYVAIPNDAVDFPFLSLPKPYTLVQLKEILAKIGIQGNLARKPLKGDLS